MQKLHKEKTETLKICTKVAKSWGQLLKCVCEIQTMSLIFSTVGNPNVTWLWTFILLYMSFLASEIRSKWMAYGHKNVWHSLGGWWETCSATKHTLLDEDQGTGPSDTVSWREEEGNLIKNRLQTVTMYTIFKWNEWLMWYVYVKECLKCAYKEISSDTKRTKFVSTLAFQFYLYN